LLSCKEAIVLYSRLQVFIDCLGCVEMDKPEKQGQAWNEPEERALYDAFLAGTAVKEIAASHGRTDGAIRSHLKLMGLVDSFGATIEPTPDFSVSGPVAKRQQKQQTIAPKKERRKTQAPQEGAPTPAEINPKFKDALAIMEGSDASLFITGKAGTGKSTLLSYFCRITKKEPVILAPTGVAALNVKGQTIHSFFNFYVDVTPQKIREKKAKPRNAKLYRKLKTIIIDEVSMVRADILDCIDAFLRLYGPRQGQAFGGVQMIFIGDLYQLPPVVNAHEKELFSTRYETPYFFSSHALQNFPLEFVELEKVYRQKDQRFVTLLNQIRNNNLAPETLDTLNARHLPDEKPPKDAFFITLTATNKRADEINEEHLEALPGRTFTSDADIAGTFTKDFYPTTPSLQFKVGAQIMMLNNDTHKRWVNGSIGVIRALKHDIEQNDYLEVLLEEQDEIVEVYPHRWEVYRFAVEDEAIVSEPVGTFTQFPFRLAWAITIHKSQGKTFEHVVIDIGRGTFAAGQMYVALSRCTSLSGIILKTPIARHHVRTDRQIFRFLSQQASCDGEPHPDDKIGQLERAIESRASLEIVYLKGDNTQTTRVIQPTRLGDEVYKGHKFLGLRARCALRNEERLFSVERILGIKPVHAA